MQNYFSHSYYYFDTYNLPYLKGIGVGHGDENYHWDNAARKDDLVVLQYTLAGTGYFEVEGQRSTQRKGSFFLLRSLVIAATMENRTGDFCIWSFPKTFFNGSIL